MYSSTIAAAKVNKILAPMCDQQSDGYLQAMAPLPLASADMPPNS
jgi:hypothetical protein